MKAMSDVISSTITSNVLGRLREIDGSPSTLGGGRAEARYGGGERCAAYPLRPFVLSVPAVLHLVGGERGLDLLEPAVDGGRRLQDGRLEALGLALAAREVQRADQSACIDRVH